jgi:hypothetical protein
MKGYVEANNKYMIYYDLKKESSYLVSVEANNLFGDGMSFKLPLKAFKWFTQKEIQELEERILEIPDDNDIGYTLKVKCLEYPKELHDKHNDYPFFPIHKNIKSEDLSLYQKKLRKITKSIVEIEDKEGLICDDRTQSINMDLNSKI